VPASIAAPIAAAAEATIQNRLIPFTRRTNTLPMTDLAKLEQRNNLPETVPTSLLNAAPDLAPQLHGL
jgi:hypothetical protein